MLKQVQHDKCVTRVLYYHETTLEKLALFVILQLDRGIQSESIRDGLPDQVGQ